MSTGRAIRTLTRTALDPDRPGTVGDLASVVAHATGSRGAVLWEAPDELLGDPTLSVLALWLDGRSPASTGQATCADPLTELAFSTRSLAMSDDVTEATAAVYGHAVTAALPVEYTDGSRGVLTLVGDGELSAAAFGTAAELVEILPELCSAVRERRTLALVNACNTILHDADVESPDHPLSRTRLGEHLSEVCDLVSDALHGTKVSIFLREQADLDGYRLLASSSGTDVGGADGGGVCAVTAEPVDLVRSGLTAGDEPLVEVCLRRGEHVIGLLRCCGTHGPPHHFTVSDVGLLRPIAVQVSRYWRNWLRRRAVAEENESWRRLAAGMTSFNKIVAELGDTTDDRRHEQQVSEAAVRIVSDVVPESTGATVFRVTHATHRAPTLVSVAGTDDGYRRAPAPGSGVAEQVLRTRSQHSLTGPQSLVAEGVTPGSGWLLCTPIRVGEQVYGMLEAVGRDAEPPANSAQVYEIIADQIGLYRHLQDTLGHLHEARLRLEISRRSEAEAMEDLKHQLVSPLRTATDRTELVLRSGRFDTRAEGQLKAIRGLCRKASRVAMSAGVFATLSKGDLPEPRLERIGVDDLLLLLIAAADDAQVLGNPRRRISFDVERDFVRALGRRLVHVDASFFQQCVGNLLDNAAKYAYEGTRVQISADVTAAALTVEVTSIGLPLSNRDLARCLQRNWRGDAARSTTGEGSGIGLWIVDNLMRAMGGRVVLKADSDRTTAALVLPLT